MLEGISELFQVVYAIVVSCIFLPITIISIITLYASQYECVYDVFIIDLSTYLKLYGSLTIIFVVVCLILSIIMCVDKLQNGRLIIGIVITFAIFCFISFILIIIGSIEAYYAYKPCSEQSFIQMLMVTINIGMQCTLIMLFIVNIALMFQCGQCINKCINNCCLSFWHR
jgi:hypothetical protein